MQYFQSKNIPLEIVISENIKKEFALHNHVSHYILAMVLDGEVEMYYNNTKITYKKDECFVIPPYMPHAVDMEKQAKLLSLCMEYSFLTACSLTEIEFLVQEKIHKLNDEIMSKEQKDKLISNLKYLYEKMEYESINFSKEITEMVANIISSSDEKLCLEHFAKDISFSKFYLVKKFKKDVGMTPHQFLIQRRVRKAQHLLNRGKSIIDTSIETGFYDQSHFNKCFTKIVGITPAKYVTSRREI